MERRLLTASVSKIKTFDDWMHASEDEPWLNEENLIDTLKGIREPNDKAEYGTGFHGIIEHGEALIVNTPVKGELIHSIGYMSNGIMFNSEQAAPALAYRAAHPLMQKEIPIYKIYHTRNFDIMVTMRVDGLEGNTVRDPKTKYSTPDMQEYMSSCQWKFYLDALNLDIFYYDVFQVSRYDTLADAHKAVIKPLEPLMQVRYPEMADDLQLLLQEFADYIEAKDFTHLLEVIPDSHVAIELQKAKYQNKIA